MTALWDVGIALTIVGLFVGLISTIAEIYFRDLYIPPIAISIIVLIIGILLVKFNGGFSILFPIS
nr:MAG TPA: hypothetical protein [Caudoviricetes sp.]